MKSLEELKKLQSLAKKEMAIRDHNKKYKMLVGVSDRGITLDAKVVLEHLLEESSKHAYPCVVSQIAYDGLSKFEPIVEVIDEYETKTVYVCVDKNKASIIFNSHILNNQIVKEYTLEAWKRGQD